jgi:hypothetical protein
LACTLLREFHELRMQELHTLAHLWAVSRQFTAGHNPGPEDLYRWVCFLAGVPAAATPNPNTAPQAYQGAAAQASSAAHAQTPYGEPQRDRDLFEEGDEDEEEMEEAAESLAEANGQHVPSPSTQLLLEGRLPPFAPLNLAAYNVRNTFIDFSKDDPEEEDNKHLRRWATDFRSEPCKVHLDLADTETWPQAFGTKEEVETEAGHPTTALPLRRPASSLVPDESASPCLDNPDMLVASIKANYMVKNTFIESSDDPEEQDIANLRLWATDFRSEPCLLVPPGLEAEETSAAEEVEVAPVRKPRPGANKKAPGKARRDVKVAFVQVPNSEEDDGGSTQDESGGWPSDESSFVSFEAAMNFARQSMFDPFEGAPPSSA